MTMKALSTRNEAPEKASRPFDKDRDGFVLAEGAAMFVIETESHAKKRGATIYAELVATPTVPMPRTSPPPMPTARARRARWSGPSAMPGSTPIRSITSTPTAPRRPWATRPRSTAVKRVFGGHALKSAGGKLMMSSTKSMHGHCLGASGAVELIACIHAVRDAVIPPTMNLDNPDEGFDIDFVPHAARERRIKYALNNTFGFGGHNVTLVIGRYE